MNEIVRNFVGQDEVEDDESENGSEDESIAPGPHDSGTPLEENTAAAAGSVYDAAAADHARVRTKCATMLYNVLRTAPLQADRLSRVFENKLPHKRCASRTQTNFFESILCFARLDTILLSNLVLPLLVDHITKIDVDIREEDDEDEEDDAAPEGADEVDGESEDDACGSEVQFELELGVDGSDGEIGQHDYEAVEVDDEDREKPRHKLDGLMNVCLSYLQAVVSEGNQEHVIHLFDVLWRCFERTVLATYQARHVQYLLFYICGQHEALPGVFLGRLYEKVISDATPAVIRQLAVAYVASFVARATYVHSNLARECLEKLCGWLREYVREARDAVVSTDRHLSFYAVCRAVLYTLCFRLADLLENEGGANFFVGLRLDTVFDSPLQPLVALRGHITAEFSSLMKRHELKYCESYTRLHSVVPGAPRVVALAGDAEYDQISDFFPFDPYTLPRSRTAVDALYREWQDSGGDEERSELSESEDNSEDDFLPGSADLSGCSVGQSSFRSRTDSTELLSDSGPRSRGFGVSNPQTVSGFGTPQDRMPRSRRRVDLGYMGDPASALARSSSPFSPGSFTMLHKGK